jgi:DNA-binding CsgD family transcriptional regulator
MDLMGHAGVFLTILALGMGGVSLSHTLYLYQRMRLPYLKIHNRIFVLFNYMIFMGLALNYFQFNLGRQLSGHLVRKIFQAYHFNLSITSFLLLYGFILLTHGLLGKGWPRGWQICFFTTFGLLIAAQTVCSLFNLSIGTFPLYILFLAVVALSSEILVAVVVIRIFLNASSVPGMDRQRALKKFAALILAIFLPNTILNIFQFFDLVSLPLYVLLISMQLLAINLLPLLFMKGFVQTMFPEHAFRADTGPPVEHLFQKYNISRREQEIIQLICQGKSNRQIEGELFISLQTVKDHVHSIFRKTGVKNRVQLTNLFRGSRPGL